MPWKYETHYERGFDEPYLVHEFIHSNGRKMEHYETEEYLNSVEEALNAAFIVKDGDIYYRTANGVLQDIPERIITKLKPIFLG